MAKRKLWKLDIDIRETNWCINLVIMDNVGNQPNLELTFAHPTKQWTELSLPRVLSFTEYIVMCRICLLFCIFLEQSTHITKLRSFVVFGCSVSYLQCTLVRMVNWIDVEISSRYTYSHNSNISYHYIWRRSLLGDYPCWKCLCRQASQFQVDPACLNIYPFSV